MAPVTPHLDLIADMVERAMPELTERESRAVEVLMCKRTTYRQWGREPEAQTMGKAVVMVVRTILAPDDSQPDTVT